MRTVKFRTMKFTIPLSVNDKGEVHLQQSYIIHVDFDDVDDEKKKITNWQSLKLGSEGAGDRANDIKPKFSSRVYGEIELSYSNEQRLVICKSVRDKSVVEEDLIMISVRVYIKTGNESAEIIKKDEFSNVMYKIIPPEAQHTWKTEDIMSKITTNSVSAKEVNMAVKWANLIYKNIAWSEFQIRDEIIPYLEAITRLYNGSQIDELEYFLVRSRHLNLAFDYNLKGGVFIYIASSREDYIPPLFILDWVYLNFILDIKKLEI